MKVGIVEFVENEMVEWYIVTGSDCGSGECGDGYGDGHAKGTSPAGILLAITNITTNGNADDITKVYDSVNKNRLGIAGKLKSIAHIINNSLDSYDYNVVADDNSTNKTNDDLLL